MPAPPEDSKPEAWSSRDEIRKEGHAAMETLYSQFIGKPLSILKQESKQCDILKIISVVLFFFGFPIGTVSLALEA